MLSQRFGNLSRSIFLVRNRKPIIASMCTAQIDPPSQATPGPVESSIRQKLKSLLTPSEITITNDSWQHRHHAPMQAQGGGNGETLLVDVHDFPLTGRTPSDFSVSIVSEAFHGKTTMQRHRLIYSALSEEFSEGLHALSLKTKTPQEVQRLASASC